MSNVAELMDMAQDVLRDPRTEAKKKTQAVCISADAGLLQIVVNFFYEKYPEYFTASARLKDADVTFHYSIPSAPRIELAPLSPAPLKTPHANTRVTFPMMTVGVKGPQHDFTFRAQVVALATILLERGRLVMRVDDAVATTDGEVDPVASRILEEAILPVLLRWLKNIILPELTQPLMDDLTARVIEARVQNGQIDAYGQVAFADEKTELGPVVPATDMAPKDGAGRLYMSMRADAINLALEALWENDNPLSWKDKDSVGGGGFKGSYEVKAWVTSPIVTIDKAGGLARATAKAKATAKGKLGLIEAKESVSGQVTLELPIRLVPKDSGKKVALQFDFASTNVRIPIDWDWGVLEPVSKHIEDPIQDALNSLTRKMAKALSNIELYVIDVGDLANSIGADVTVTCEKTVFQGSLLQGQFAIVENP
jgi:hypothetical protein